MPGEALQFAASLAAIIVLVAITYGLGFRTGATLSDEAEARELFRLAPGGFEPEDIILDANRTCALARDGGKSFRPPAAAWKPFRRPAPAGRKRRHGRRRRAAIRRRSEPCLGRGRAGAGLGHAHRR